MGSPRFKPGVAPSPGWDSYPPSTAVVGGAATLTVPGAGGSTLSQAPDYPAALRNIAQACSDRLAACRAETAVDWAHLSPAALMEPGQRTGQYRLGTDELLLDAHGDSTISTEDLAVALLDEAERPTHHQMSSPPRTDLRPGWLSVTSGHYPIRHAGLVRACTADRRPVVWICQSCAVEHAQAVEVCAICADERQYVPATGQQWTTLDELAASGHQTRVRELEPDLFGLTVEPQVGIGQQAHLVRTPAGNLLWDPTGYLDEPAVRRVRELGEVAAIVASHPHMFGVQVEWSQALGGVPVLVAEPDLQWILRPDPVIRSWAGTLEVVPGLTLVQVGGHYPGSAVAHWAAGAGGNGVLLGGDTIQSNPDRTTVTFMRSYPNRIPLSAAVVDRITRAVQVFTFDRLYDNFGHTIDTDARAAVRRSADRYIAWVRGDFDHLT